MAKTRPVTKPLGGKAQVILLESFVLRMEGGFPNSILSCHVGEKAASLHLRCSSPGPECRYWLQHFAAQLRSYAQFIEDEAEKFPRSRGAK